MVNARFISKYAKENIVLKMMFREAASEADVAFVYSQLSSLPSTKTANIISREDAREIMAAEIGDDYEQVIGINPFPYSIDFTVNEEWANVDSLAAIETAFEKNELVREVYYRPMVVKKVEANMRMIGWILLGIALAFLVIAVTLINSTVRLTMYSKRFLIKSMQLVGATRPFVRRPFMWDSIATGISAGLAACLVILGCLFFLKEVNPALNLIDNAFILTWLFTSILALGFMITGISSYFAINRYLNLKLEELY